MVVEYAFASVGPCGSTGRPVKLGYEMFVPPPHQHPDPKSCPLLLLIPAIGCPGGIWTDRFCGAIAAEGYRVVRFDQRDTGRSTHFMDETGDSSSGSPPPPLSSTATADEEGGSSSNSNNNSNNNDDAGEVLDLVEGGEDDTGVASSTPAPAPPKKVAAPVKQPWARKKGLLFLFQIAFRPERAAESLVYNIEDLATDVERLLDHLHVTVAHLVGFSLGGMVAQTFALKHPTRVGSLTLIATHHHGPGVKLPAGSALVSLFPCIPLPFPRWFPPPSLDGGVYTKPQEAVLQQHAMFAVKIGVKVRGSAARSEGEDFASVMKILRRAGPLDYHGGYRHLAAYLSGKSRADALSQTITSRLEDKKKLFDDVKNQSAPFYIPTTVINGSKDPLAPSQNAVLLSESIPGSSLVIMPELGHRLDPEVRNPLIREILRTVELREKVIGMKRLAAL